MEFGLIDTAKGLRAYGSGILSSLGERIYALKSNVPQRRPFEPVDALRTPYRIDIYQNVYFVIDSLQDLFALIEQARAPGMHAPTFPPKETGATSAATH